MTISRRRILGGGTAAAAGLLLGPRAEVDADLADLAPRKLVLVVASGGWDPVYALDPKPGLVGIDVPIGDLEEHAGIPLWGDPSRPATSAFFAAHAERCTMVHGLQVQSLVHADCSKRVLTGTASDGNPDIGAIVAYELGRDLPVPYLVLGQTSYAGPYASIAARAGTVNQIGTLLDPLAALPDAQGDFTPRFFPDDVEAELVRGYLTAAAEREKALRGQHGHNARRLQDFVDALTRGDALARIGDFGEIDFTRDLGVQAQIALDALQQGLSHVVHVELGDWDTHDSNLRQAERHETFFAGLHALVDELVARPGAASGSALVDETLVVVVSEMGRTPRQNAQGGKDHWPVTSAMVLGGGVAGGRVLGATDDALQGRSVDLATGAPSDSGTALQYGNFAAAVLALAGVDPAAYLPNSEPLHALCT